MNFCCLNQRPVLVAASGLGKRVWESPLQTPSHHIMEGHMLAIVLADSLSKKKKVLADSF